MSDVYEMMKRLVLDSDFEEAFRADPKSVMSAYGLSAQECDLLLQPDGSLALNHVNHSLAREDRVQPLVSCLALEPGPDYSPDPDPFPEPGRGPEISWHAAAVRITATD